MGHKSRGNWRVDVCLKNCLNRGKCKDCIGSSLYIDALNPPKRYIKKTADEYKKRDAHILYPPKKMD